MIRVVLLGAPGAGKGTQAKRIAEFFSVPAISTGEIFRSNIADETELGCRAKVHIEKGELVPDAITDPMVAVRLSAPDVQEGFLLDGYPRSVAQAKALAKELAKSGTKVDAVVELVADEQVVIERLRKRADLEGRSDDTENVMRHRMEVYRKTTEPLAAYYADNDLLIQVDGLGTVEEVWDRIRQVLAPLAS